jgi:hypothetical protein
MMTTTRYFWSSWFSGQSYGKLAVVFMLLSLADLAATMRLLPMGVREGNLLADRWLTQYGMLGFIFYKAALVAVVLMATWILARYRPNLSKTVLWTGLMVTGLVVIRHLGIVAGFAAL